MGSVASATRNTERNAGDFASNKNCNLRSYPPSLIFRRGEGGHDRIICKKADSVFFSDWSRNNSYETLRSYWLTDFNLISGQKVGLARRKQNGGDRARFKRG